MSARSLDQQTAEERNIRRALVAVSRLGPNKNQHLADAVDHLEEALKKVADFFDGVPVPEQEAEEVEAVEETVEAAAEEPAEETVEQEYHENVVDMQDQPLPKEKLDIDPYVLESIKEIIDFIERGSVTDFVAVARVDGKFEHWFSFNGTAPQCADKLFRMNGYLNMLQTQTAGMAWAMGGYDQTAEGEEDEDDGEEE